jgi:hypothetical protein
MIVNFFILLVCLLFRWNTNILIFTYCFNLQEISAAFVSFKSRYAAANAIYIRQSDNPTEWQTEHAPDPHDVYWPNFSTTFMERWISKFIVFVASVLLIIVFLIVVAFIQGLTYMEQLEAWLPFLKNILEMLVSVHRLYTFSCCCFIIIVWKELVRHVCSDAESKMLVLVSLISLDLFI